MWSDGKGDVMQSWSNVQCIGVTRIGATARYGAVSVAGESGVSSVSGEDVPTSCHSTSSSAIQLISEGNGSGGGMGDEERNLF